MSVLSLNCGSSSIKYQLYDWQKQEVLAKGMVDRIGLSESNIVHKVKGEKKEYQCGCADHKKGLQIILDFLLKESGVISSLKDLDGVGHRVVHGGDKFAESVLINAAVLAEIKASSDLAPLHNPPNITGIVSAAEILPGIPQIAIFDTAFHQSIPEYAYTYGLSLELRDKYKVRRYGFHGSSHRYVTEQAQKYLGQENCKLITIHVGNGGSLAAIKNGKSIDTSMGLTPLAGIVMGTRSGDLDPGIIPFLMERTGMDTEAVFKMLNKESGMLGLTGKFSDQREIRDGYYKGDAKCKLALEIQAYSIRKYLGAYLAILNGADAIVFTGGIGENSPLFREFIVKDLENLGVVLDKEANEQCQASAIPQNIAAAKSVVKILVIATDEEYIIARDVMTLIKKGQQVKA